MKICARIICGPQKKPPKVVKMSLGMQEIGLDFSSCPTYRPETALCIYKTRIKKWREKRLKPLISQGFQVSVSILVTQHGTNGDTELFKKSRNINGFRACRIANNLY